MRRPINDIGVCYKNENVQESQITQYISLKSVYVCMFSILYAVGTVRIHILYTRIRDSNVISFGRSDIMINQKHV
jgi:hypothetical protein